MALDVNALRSFLVASPRPAKILVTSGDGEQKEILPPKGVGGVTWAGVARSIETLDPSTVELFDPNDKLIRAQRFDAATRVDSATTAALPEILARDAESARVALFAQLLAQAYKFSVDTAFTKFVEMFERLDRRQELIEARLERTEREYRRAMEDKIADALEDAEEAAKQAEQQQADPAAALVQTFMGGVSAAQNGKGAKP
jgi:hypothetical protein